MVAKKKAPMPLDEASFDIPFAPKMVNCTFD